MAILGASDLSTVIGIIHSQLHKTDNYIISNENNQAVVARYVSLRVLDYFQMQQDILTLHSQDNHIYTYHPQILDKFYPVCTSSFPLTTGICLSLLKSIYSPLLRMYLF